MIKRVSLRRETISFPVKEGQSIVVGVKMQWCVGNHFESCVVPVRLSLKDDNVVLETAKGHTTQIYYRNFIEADIVNFVTGLAKLNVSYNAFLAFIKLNDNENYDLISYSAKASISCSKYDDETTIWFDIDVEYYTFNNVIDDAEQVNKPAEPVELEGEENGVPQA